MPPEELAFLREAVRGLLAHPIDGFRLPDGTDSWNWIRRDGLQYGSVNHERSVATAFTVDGAAAIVRLADTIRKRLPDRRRAVDTPTLSLWIARRIAFLWGNREGTGPNGNEAVFAEALEAWFASHAEPRIHFVPCAILRDPALRFALGPVSFVHRTDFDARDHGIHSPVGIQHHFKDLFEQMEERSANWIARVEVRGRELRQSTEAADLAVDVALGALQLAFGPRNAFRRFARTTGRMQPPQRYDVSMAKDQVQTSSAWTAAGFGISASAFNAHIRRSADLLTSAGHRLSAYLTGTVSAPALNEAWCNATYWYHEAVAEPLDTVAVTKLETAIEILLRAESTSGSARRIRQGCLAFLGLDQYQSINPGSSITVDQLAAAITAARSQVLHGTWPTLGPDLPERKGQVALTFATVEALARTFLITATLQLDAYIAVGEMPDDVDSFLDWVARSAARS